MTWFNNLPLRTKFLLIALMLLVFLFSLSAIAVNGLLTVNNLLQTVDRQERPAIYELAVTSEKLQLARNANRQALAELQANKITALLCCGAL